MTDYATLSKTELIRRLKAISSAQPFEGEARERLLHELQVHQLELEEQNKALKSAQAELEESRDRYADLYDFAPAGYITLERTGMILEINLTGALLLGKERSRLVGSSMTRNLEGEQRQRFRQHLREIFSDRKSASCELRLNNSGNPIHVSLESVWHGSVCRTVMVDITQRVAAERSLQQKRSEEDAILKAVPIGVGMVRDDAILWINQQLGEMLGYPEEELVGKSFGMAYASEQEYQRICRIERREIAHKGSGTLETRWRRKDGEFLDIHLRSSAIVPMDIAQGVVFTAEDITERKRLERDALLAKAVLENTSEGVMITTADTVILVVNPAFEKVTGYCAAECIGHQPRMLASGHQSAGFYQKMWQTIEHTGRWAGEIWNRRKNGEVYPEWLSITTIRDDRGRVANYVGVFTDISSQVQAKERLRRQAYYDMLTELPNRTLFYDRLRVALSQAQRGGHKMALMFLDLDHFKDINDTLGHNCGDQLLVEVGKRLHHSVREADTIARLSGDEFATILPNITTPETVAKVASKILASLSRPYLLEGREFVVTVSIGISLFPRDGEDGPTLLKHADSAMYQAKKKGRNGYCFYAG